jgi:hypothetical protein
MCGFPVTKQFASVSKSATLPSAHVTFKHQRGLRAGSNAASNSISVQMAIIVSLHKIMKEPPGVSGHVKPAPEWLLGVLEAVAAAKP